MPKSASTQIAVIGIDIGKNSFHVVGLDRRGAIVLRQKGVAWPSWGTACELAAVPHRHGSLCRGASSEPKAQGTRP
jgi:transposase